MNEYEKYYRRSYNAINQLIEVYRNGYDEKKMLEFRKELINNFKLNPKVAQSEINNVSLTFLISLLGLNKEAIENTGKIIEYKKTANKVDMPDSMFTNKQKERLKSFYDSKVVSTDFDEWLSIKINPNTDNNNVDYLRRVRNALLHSNFTIDEDSFNMPFTKLKTKSYYEAELFNLQFQLFVLEYFGNIESLGLVENICTFEMLKEKINGPIELLDHLRVMKVNQISYKNLKTLGVDSPELVLKESLDKDCCVDSEKFVGSLIDNTNIDDVCWETSKLSDEHIVHLMNFIGTNYGIEFYEMDCNTQGGIISTYLKYELNPKIEISNWLCHFWYLYSTLLNGRFNISFFEGDEFGKESCFPALMVLKSYLIMYRLQNKEFDDIDYSKVNFNICDPDIYVYNENEDKTPVTGNYFNNSFIKEKNKNSSLTDKEIFNKIICEVIRDSLAHGNIRTYTSPVTLKPMIELKDINPKSGATRVIALPLSKYENFLNSEAFKPAYCYTKESSKTLVKK